jgi:hypothetical protein
VRGLPDDAVCVEIGSYLGQSAIAFGLWAKKRKRPTSFKLICVDPWLGVDESNIVDPRFVDEQRKLIAQCGGTLKPGFDHNCKAYGISDWIDARQMTSVEAAATFADASVDRVMVDGDHAAASVQADLEAWWPKLKPGGEMVGHDDDWPDVNRTVRAWAAEQGVNVLPLSVRCWRVVKPATEVEWTVPPGNRVCLVAVCSNERTIYKDTVKSLVSLGWGPQVLKAMQANEFADIRFAWFDKAHGVDVLRESVGVFALRGQYSHVLFLDADMTWPTNLLETILQYHDCGGVMSGLYHMKGWPHHPIAYHEARWNDPHQVVDYTYDHAASHATEPRLEKLIGMGCALVPVKVFEILPRPWFKYQMHGETGLMTVSEDVWFCQQLDKHEIAIWLDPSIDCGHIDSHIVTGQDHHRAMFDVAHVNAGTVPALPHELPQEAKAS